MARRKKHKQRIKADDTVAAIARRVCREHFTHVVKWLPLALELNGDSGEAMHRLRVATRRAAAAIEFFSNWLPPKGRKWLDQQFHKIRSASGDARDMDVLFLRLADDARQMPRDAFTWLIRRAALLRCAAQQPLNRCVHRLMKKKFKKRGLVILSRLQWRAKGDEPSLPEHAAQTLGDFVRDLTKLQKKLRRQPRKLHELRILLKRLRYSLELAADVLAPSITKATQERLVALQDRLGRMNDDIQLNNHLRDWAKECREKPIEKGVLRWSERTESQASERLAALADELPREIAGLLTMVRQLSPMANKSS